MYDFNLLVSCPWAGTRKATCEIAYFLRLLGDEEPVIKKTMARGIIGVKTHLDARKVIRELKALFIKDPSGFKFTLKWVPIDLWTNSDIESMRTAVEQVKGEIKQGERWRMTVEKRRYTLYHKVDIIKMLAEHIGEKVDLKNPDKILRIEIIGKYAGVAILSSEETFSTTKLPS